VLFRETKKPWERLGLPTALMMDCLRKKTPVDKLRIEAATATKKPNPLRYKTACRETFPIHDSPIS
jgi:hypothetical protein